MSSILDYIPTELKQVASTNGGEFAGPCPECGGKDRFRVWPQNRDGIGQFWCRQCDWNGDGINMAVHSGLTMKAALQAFGRQRNYSPISPTPVKPISAPNPLWQGRANTIAVECEQRLWSVEGEKALAYLRGRGLEDRTIRAASLGYNHTDRYEGRGTWGMPDGKKIWIPRGITIPWVLSGGIWRLNVRRAAGEPKYVGPAGYSQALYNSDYIKPGKPAVLVEGEFDAWIISQMTNMLGVATGSSSGARSAHWAAKLMQASIVLVAFDADQAGDKASEYWLSQLSNAKRWRPYWGDVNQMLVDGADLSTWAHQGITSHPVAA